MYVSTRWKRQPEEAPGKLQGASKKSGISKSVKFCVIVPELWGPNKDSFMPHKIEFIAVILSIIDFLSSKGCPRYQHGFLYKQIRYYFCFVQLKISKFQIIRLSTIKSQSPFDTKEISLLFNICLRYPISVSRFSIQKLVFNLK